MAEELKPCPFCGGRASVEPFNDSNWFASCNDCDATIEDFPNRSEAIKAWNDRCNILEQRLKKLVHKIWHYVVDEHNTRRDFPGVDMSIFEKEIEELGINLYN